MYPLAASFLFGLSYCHDMISTTWLKHTTSQFASLIFFPSRNQFPILLSNTFHCLPKNRSVMCTGSVASCVWSWSKRNLLHLILHVIVSELSTKLNFMLLFFFTYHIVQIFCRSLIFANFQLFAKIFDMRHGFHIVTARAAMDNIPLAKLQDPQRTLSKDIPSK